ncbi:AAA family ATPase [Ferruginibacter sp.]|nr:AAA family ATPase [Ferruginibacter sp.]
MQIKKLSLPKNVLQSINLTHLEMNNLDRVVIIAGKNGSGKTRVLNSILNFRSELDDSNSSEINRRKNNLKTDQTYLNYLRKKKLEHDTEMGKEVKDLKKMMTPDDYQFTNLKINELQISIPESERNLGLALFIEYDEPKPKGDIYKFIPKKIDLKDSNELSNKQLKNLLNEVGNQKMDDFSESTTGIIQSLQNIVYNNQSENFLEENEKEYLAKAQNVYSKLNSLIYDFLGVELKRNVHGEATLFSKEVNECNLSEGQKILLQLSLALTFHDVNIENAVLLLDEPENHLHPKILIDVLEKIISLNTNGQIWIATHSLPLIAHFDTSYLWHMEDSKIKYVGREPEKVVTALLGEKEKEKIFEFVTSTNVFAASKFATECLLPPRIVETGQNDPQTNQINKIIAKLYENEEKIRILDFGAGKGRLLSFLKEKYPSNLDKRIDYFAYDLEQENKEVSSKCLDIISKVYPDELPKKKRYFTKDIEFHKLNPMSFDIVIMCNVLHEIEPNQWLEILGTQSIISKNLKLNGYLLIVEDQEIPIGEKAYKNGFMVFDESQFKKLFGFENETKDYIVDDARNDGRLKGHLIPKSHLINCTPKSIEIAISNLMEFSLTKIGEYRKLQSNYKNGMKLSFWLNQYANASLNLIKFK